MASEDVTMRAYSVDSANTALHFQVRSSCRATFPGASSGTLFLCYSMSIQPDGGKALFPNNYFV